MSSDSLHNIEVRLTEDGLKGRDLTLNGPGMWGTSRETGSWSGESLSLILKTQAYSGDFAG